MFKKKVIKLLNDTHPNNYSVLQEKMGLTSFDATKNNNNKGLYICGLSFISLSLVMVFCLLIIKPINHIEMISKKEMPINEPSSIKDESFIKSILNMSRSFNYSIHGNHYNNVTSTTNLYMSLASLYLGAESTTKDELKRMMYLEDDTNLLFNLEKLVKSVNKVTYNKNGNVTSGVMLRNAMFVDNELRYNLDNEYLYQLDNYLFNDVFLAKRDDDITRDYMLSYYNKYSNNDNITSFDYSSYKSNIGLVNCLYLKTNIEEDVTFIGNNMKFNNADGSVKEVYSIQIEATNKDVYFSDDSYAFEIELSDDLKLNILRLNKPLEKEVIKANYEDLLNYKTSSKFSKVNSLYYIDLPLFTATNHINVASVYDSLNFHNVFNNTSSYHIFNGKHFSIDYWASTNFHFSIDNDLISNNNSYTNSNLSIDKPFLYSVTINSIPLVVGAINIL